MAADEHGEETIRDYVELQAGEEVVHVEKAASERVGPVRHDIWDVHCESSRWWVVTKPDEPLWFPGESRGILLLARRSKLCCSSDLAYGIGAARSACHAKGRGFESHSGARNRRRARAYIDPRWPLDRIEDAPGEGAGEARPEPGRDARGPLWGFGHPMGTGRARLRGAHGPIDVAGVPQ